MVDPMLPQQQMREQQNMASQIETALQESGFDVGLVPFEVYMFPEYTTTSSKYNVLYLSTILYDKYKYMSIYIYMYIICIHRSKTPGLRRKVIWVRRVILSAIRPKSELPDQISRLLLASFRLHLGV